MKYAVLTVTVLILATSFAMGEDYGIINANNLRNNCQMMKKASNGTTNMSDVDVMDGGYCAGYVAGFLDSLAGMQVTVTETILVGQVAEMFVKYMNEHPEDLNQNGAFMLLKTLGSYKKIARVPTTTSN